MQQIVISGFAPGICYFRRATFFVSRIIPITLSFNRDESKMEALATLDSRPARRKFSKPPVKVACLSWYAPVNPIPDPYELTG